MGNRRLDAFTVGYIDAMFFTETGHIEDGELRDATLADLAPKTRTLIIDECRAFQEQNETYLLCAYLDADGPDYTATMAGHDFWLTRNGHGAGFWDRGLRNNIGTALSMSTRGWGTLDLVLGADGALYLEG